MSAGRIPMTTSALDGNLKAKDPSDMLGAILGLPEQIANAKKIALDADLGDLGSRKFANVVIAGMGGSAIGGSMLQATYSPVLSCPVVVNHSWFFGRYLLCVSAAEWE